MIDLFFILEKELKIMSKIVYVTDATFEQDVLKSDLPVLLDFWADWCGPCKMIAPVLEQLAEELDGQVRIAKLNVDENRMIAAQYGIRGIPTLMVFKNGENVATKVGALAKAQLNAFVQDSIA